MTPVERMYEEFRDLIQLLKGQSEISLLSAAEDNFRRCLLLAAASYFEVRLVECVVNYSHKKSTDPMLREFVRIKGVERQYHNWFNWNSLDANPFFALFGREFRQFMKQTLRTDPSLKDALDSFMELGSDRNRLVHENFAVFTLEKTGEDIFKKYSAAIRFVDQFPILLENCSSNKENTDT